MGTTEYSYFYVKKIIGIWWFSTLKIEYSNHALIRLKIRNIEKSEIEQALLSPQKIYFDIATGYLVAIAERKARKNHWLIVVYTKLDDIYRVVTVIDTKSLNKIIQRRILSGRWIKIW